MLTGVVVVGVLLSFFGAVGGAGGCNGTVLYNGICWGGIPRQTAPNVDPLPPP
jgi:hypothetical protein